MSGWLYVLFLLVDWGKVKYGYSSSQCNLPHRYGNSHCFVCQYQSSDYGCEDRLRNDLYCVEWGVKLYSIHPYGNSHAMWDHIVLPATRRADIPALIPAEAGTRFNDPEADLQ